MILADQVTNYKVVLAGQELGTKLVIKINSKKVLLLLFKDDRSNKPPNKRPTNTDNKRHLFVMVFAFDPAFWIVFYQPLNPDFAPVPQ